MSMHALLLAVLLQADFSGIDRFWQIADMLQRDVEPDSTQWNALFATSGYAALEARERRRAAITLGMRAAFKPSLRAARDSILATNTWTARVIRHMQSLPAQRTHLDSVRSRLVSARFLDAAAKQAETLLPRGTVATHGMPNVAFVFFLPDGRGYPGLIVADLANIARKTDIVPFFAHEATHFYLARINREKRSAPSTPGDSALLTMLNKLYEESMGDQHDKAPYVAMTDAQFRDAPMDSAWRDYMTRYRTEYNNARSEIKRIAELLKEAAASGDDVVKTVADSLNRAMPLEGRPIGFYITRQIRLRSGDAVLRRTAGDATAWVRAYNAVAMPKLSF